MVEERKSRYGEPSLVRQIFYGRLEYILVCHLPNHEHFRVFNDSLTRLLALVTPCSTGGQDATEVLTMYSRTTTAVITDLRSIEAVIGRIETRGNWGIIDRTDHLAHTVFVDEENDD